MLHQSGDELTSIRPETIDHPDQLQYQQVPELEHSVELGEADANQSPPRCSYIRCTSRYAWVLPASALLLVGGLAICAIVGSKSHQGGSAAEVAATDEKSFSQDFEVSIGMRPSLNEIPERESGLRWHRKEHQPHEKVPLIPGSTIALMGPRHGKYCADEVDAIKCEQDAINGYARFTVVDAGAGRIALKGPRIGRYCTDGSDAVKCDENAINAYERFTVVDAGSGRVALKGGRNDKYCTDDVTVRCNQDSLNSWEVFTVTCLDACRQHGQVEVPLPQLQESVLRGEAKDYDMLLQRAPTENNFYNSLQQAVGYSVVGLTQEHFRDGTYVISQPGVYKLLEDIVFEPRRDYEYMPPRDQEPYSWDSGYWLGFYAAISVMASNVLIDLNGKKVSMSRQFALRQRYFSVVELSSKPFKANAGPDVLGLAHAGITGTTGVTIHNGVLGLSSHFGVHGTDNVGIWLDRVVIRDFEVGGIQLNGASNIHVSNVHVGPSLGAPGSSGYIPTTARFSMAQFMLNVVRNTGIEWMKEFGMLKSDADDYIAGRTQKHPVNRQRVFDDPGQVFTGLPHGSAVYGIHFHTTGPALHDFALCAAAQQQESTLGSQQSFFLDNVVIQDLHIKTDEVVRMMWNPSRQHPVPLTGIAGETFQGTYAARDDGRYSGDDFVEAQLAFEKLKNSTPADMQVNYGEVSLPHEVLAWTRGRGTLEDLERAGMEYDCHRDAMGHSNKGAVGLRLDGLTNVRLANVAIRHLKNHGSRGPSHVKCPRAEGEFKGADVRGISLSNVAGLQGSRVAVSHLESMSGMAMGVEVRHGDQDIHFSGLSTSHLRGENGDLRNAMAYVARHETEGLAINQA